MRTAVKHAATLGKALKRSKSHMLIGCMRSRGMGESVKSGLTKLFWKSFCHLSQKHFSLFVVLGSKYHETLRDWLSLPSATIGFGTPFPPQFSVSNRLLLPPITNRSHCLAVFALLRRCRKPIQSASVFLPSHLVSRRGTIELTDFIPSKSRSTIKHTFQTAR